VEILAEILAAVKTGARKTRIMYQANLSFDMLKKYLGYALQAGLVVPPSESNGVYSVSDRGCDFLERYDRYMLRNTQVEDQLRVMARERAMLEENYVAKMSRVNSRNSLPKQGNTIEIRS
jgi:predicted transcriptional regulator